MSKCDLCEICEARPPRSWHLFSAWWLSVHVAFISWFMAVGFEPIFDHSKIGACVYLPLLRLEVFWWRRSP